VTRDVWLGKHPYLRPLADLHETVKVTVNSIPLSTADIPRWDDYINDFKSGVPLLRSTSVAIDFEPLIRPMMTVVRTLASKSLPGILAENIRDLEAELERKETECSPILVFPIDEHSFSSVHSGLLRYLGWMLMAHYFSDLVTAFGVWREEESWLRPYCPTCGALPAMAQLVGLEHGRMRFLCCGQCGTNWNYPRVGCPFCGNEDDQRMGHLAVEGEPVLRVDYCEVCSGYLKTYNGAGSESLFLADWTSLHLDIAACDRGLRRFAESLYQV